MNNKVLTEAKKWIGYLEKKSNSQLEDFWANAGSNNYTIFAKWYDEWWKQSFSLQANPWCAVFVSAVFRRALGQEVQERIMPRFHYCPTGVAQFKKLDAWVAKDPLPGDVIFFKNSSGVAYHVGLVRAVDSRCVYTIEGNTSSAAGVVDNGGCVAEKSYSLTHSAIMGYGRPNYEEDVDMEKLEELRSQVERLTATVARLADLCLPKYGYVDENMPEWARATIEKLYRKGIILGDETGNLQLSYNDLRNYVINDRAGIYGE